MNATGKKYEVRTLRGAYWQVDSRSSDRGAALSAANGLAANRSIDGVIVVEEFFDSSRGRYQERTVFSYFRLDDERFCSTSMQKLSCQMPSSPRPLALGPSDKHLGGSLSSFAYV